MAANPDRIKRLVTFKEKLGKRVDELKAELEEAEATLEAVNSILLEKSFNHAKMPEKDEQSATSSIQQSASVSAEPSFRIQEGEAVTPLRTAGGETLAILYVEDDCLHVLPEEGKSFNVNTPPFTQFLIERVLMKMQERDNELAKAGQITVDRMFSYTVAREGDTIREISVKNVDPDRLRELKSSIRWTFEKMYEKAKAP